MPEAEHTEALPADGRPRMVDIARLAGRSVSTVSRALSGCPTVSAKTRARVEALVSAQHYTINQRARQLRQQQVRTMSVIVPIDPLSRQQLGDPLLSELIGQVADALAVAGYDMLLSRLAPEQLGQAASLFDSGRVAGVLVLGQGQVQGQATWHAGLGELQARKVPVVVWGAALPGLAHAWVGTDDLRGGEAATAHLLACGARQIAFLGDPLDLRHQGYCRALVAAGLTPDPALTLTPPPQAAGMRAGLAGLLQRAPRLDGIVATSDLVALAAIAALRPLGRRVPDDIGVVGDGDAPWASLSQPPLTTVRQPLQAAAQTLVALLVAAAAGLSPGPVLLPTRLVQRESTADAGQAAV